MYNSRKKTNVLLFIRLEAFSLLVLTIPMKIDIRHHSKYNYSKIQKVKENRRMKARSLIKLPAYNEKGFSHKFIWIFPKPMFGKFNALEEANKEFLEEMGRYIIYNAHVHNYSVLSV